MSGPWEDFQQAESEATPAPEADVAPWEMFAEAQPEDAPTERMPISEAVGINAAQGPTAGFGDELSSLVSAIIPTETDKALGRDYGDRYQSIKKTFDKDLAKATKDRPIISALTEIVTGAPLAMATGGLAKLGLAKQAAVAGAQGAAYGLGKSKKATAAEAVKDSALSGLVSFGLTGATGAVGQFAKDLKIAGLSSGVDEFGNAASKMPAPIAKATKEGDILIKYGVGLKDSFKVGREMQEALNDPTVQNKIVQEANAVPTDLFGIKDTPDSGLVGATMNSLQEAKKPILQQYGSVPVDPAKAFSKELYDSIYAIQPGVNDKVQLGRDILLKKTIEIEDALRANPTLATLDQQKRMLGKTIWEDGVFQGAGPAERSAKKVWSKLTNLLHEVDRTEGSGGNLANIDEVFTSLFKMKEKPLKGTTLISLTDPQATAADATFQSFKRPWVSLPMDLKRSLAPELDDYLTQRLPTVVTKAQIMKLVSGRGLQNRDGGLMSLVPGGRFASVNLHNLANKAGTKFSTSAAPAPAFSTTGVDTSAFKQTTTRALSPALGALGTSED